METENKEIQEASEDVAAALADVDPEDTQAQRHFLGGPMDPELDDTL